MVSFPNCKINIGLNITEKRKDNFHNLETIFFPIPFFDVLELIKTENAEDNPFEFSTTGLKINETAENNICFKAYQLVSEKIKPSTKLKMHLQKNIPMGAGLGGGSADGAFALQLLNDVLNLKIDEKTLAKMALQLGSDCPFFLKNEACYAEGRGETFSEIKLNLKGYHLVLINPGIHISTGKLFSMITPHRPEKNLRELIKLPIKQWKNNIVNDFEEPVFSMFEPIADIKKKLYAHGALYASMTGTGSTVYGIFDQEIKINFPNEYFIKKILL